MKKVFANVFFTIVIIQIVSGSNGLYASSKDIDDFDILGIKLGMQPEDVVKVKP